MSASKPSDKVAAPARCPSCASTDLKTTSKTVDTSTYWRCAACGDVWNDARRQAGDRYGTGDRYGRR